MITELITVGGVSDMSSDNNFKVVQKAAGANMSVDVGVGKAYVRGDTSNVYPVRNTAVVNTAIGNNSSGNPRKDAVVLYVDLAASSNADASNVAKILIVPGTPGASPALPTDGEIQTAVGASNPFLRLANVTVANGETTIDTVDISDTRVRFRTRHYLHEYTDSDASTITFDVSKNNYHKVEITANRTLAVSGVSIGDSFIVKIKQDGTGGHTVTWWSLIDWFGGTPVLTPTASKVDAFLFVKKADGRYDGYVIGQDATDA
jgi:hypothetical protein